jgi:DNA-binding response OmpR family regulator
MRRVLIVEDEALVALTIEDILVEAGYTVVGIADRPADALELARRAPIDIAVVDVRLADGGDGIALASALAALGSMLILFATGNPAEVRARARVGHGCLTKPFEGEWLLSAIDAIRTNNAPPIPGYFSLPAADASR